MDEHLIKLGEDIMLLCSILLLLGILAVFIKYLYKDCPKCELTKPRRLNKKDAEFIADYFHNDYYCPDYDGYCGKYDLPPEVMDIYIKKYSKKRGWD